MTSRGRAFAAILLPLVLISAAGAVVVARITFGFAGWVWNLDSPKIDYPLALFFHEALAGGRLPLWEENLGLGFPLYAEGQIGAFYPPNWLFFQLEPLAATDLSRLLHLTLAGTGAGLLALRVSGSRPGAILAAVVVVMGGAIATKLMWWNQVAAYGWLPWVLLPIAGRSPPGRLATVGAGVLWGIQALTGHPPTWLLTGLAAVILLLRPPWLTAIGRVAAFGIVGLAAGAVQLVPTTLLVPLSDRAGGFPDNELFGNAATPFDVLGAGFANAFIRTVGDAWDYTTNWYPDGHFPLLQAGVYIGLPILALAGAGAAARRGRPWLVLAAVMVLIPVVAAFELDLWRELPILNGQRSPVRSYMVVAVAAAVLAAIGISRLGRTRAGVIGSTLAVGIPVIVYVAVTGILYAFPALFDQLLIMSNWHISSAGLDRARELARLALTSLWPLALEMTLGLLAVVLVTRPRRAWTVMAAVAVAVMPLALLMPAVNPARPASDFSFEDSAFIRALQDEDAHRVLTFDAPGWYAGMPDQLAAADVPDIAMFSSLDLGAVDALIRRLRTGDDRTMTQRAVGIDVTVTFGEPCPGRASARVAGEDAYICRLPGATLPPYWVPEAVAEVRSAPTAFPPRAELDVAAVTAGWEPVTTVSRSSTRHEVTVDQPEAGWVYFDRGWWPSWRLTLDGAEVVVYEALGGQIVSVPAGSHRIVAELTLVEVQIGLVVGVAIVGGGFGWAWWPTRRRLRAVEQAVDPGLG